MTAILTLDQAGQPNRWSTLEDALYYHLKGLIAWSQGEDEYHLHGGYSKSGQRTVVALPSIIAVRNIGFAGRVPLTNQNLFSRDDNICCYCGLRFPRGQLTREHVIPVARGGPNTWTNCATCCKPCNNAKGCMLPEEAGVKLLYVPYAPNTAESLILAGRNIKADQMEFLRACLPPDSRLLGRLN
ncbi:cysteine desulfurase [Novimethylophilus kurashikiensis]|uniref:Cysteine desulfurase n=1 Tax=Novimethylophilus kurashikiensis TaxID=1825523 RepID=A0A2R5FBP0_9PROT|nr:HNH endonuclease [Novimethylophilus kurashikiensis]GBG14323.1 cysteine desulfurase [Novimethylophilus kurashikiensis]